MRYRFENRVDKGSHFEDTYTLLDNNNNPIAARNADGTNNSSKITRSVPKNHGKTKRSREVQRSRPQSKPATK